MITAVEKYYKGKGGKKEPKLKVTEYCKIYFDCMPHFVPSTVKIMKDKTREVVEGFGDHRLWCRPKQFVDDGVNYIVERTGLQPVLVAETKQISELNETEKDELDYNCIFCSSPLIPLYTDVDDLEKGNPCEVMLDGKTWIPARFESSVFQPCKYDEEGRRERLQKISKLEKKNKEANKGKIVKLRDQLWTGYTYDAWVNGVLYKDLKDQDWSAELQGNSKTTNLTGRVPLPESASNDLRSDKSQISSNRAHLPVEPFHQWNADCEVTMHLRGSLPLRLSKETPSETATQTVSSMRRCHLARLLY